MSKQFKVAIAAIGIHLCIGSVYAWSVLTLPIAAAIGASVASVSWAFSIAIFFLGISAAVLGRRIEKAGPRKAGEIAALFFLAGLSGTALAIGIKSIWLLYLSYGVLCGIGLGIGYITPISALVAAFPDRRGMATGIAIFGFGMSSLIFAPLINWLITMVGVISTIEFMMILFYVVMRSSARLFDEKTEQECETSVSAAAAVKTLDFWLLWLFLFVNITCGIGLLSVLSPYAQSLGMSAADAALVVGLAGAANGLGRLFWSAASDRLGRPRTYSLFFLLQAACFYFLSAATGQAVFTLLIILIMSCYGGGFATMPAFLSDRFGAKELSAIHGRILTAWAAAGIAGPLLVVHGINFIWFAVAFLVMDLLNTKFIIKRQEK